MVRKVTAKSLRESILARREENLEILPNNRLRPKKVELECNKTPLMMLIERQMGQKIEKLIWDGSIREVSNKLSISNFTVTCWRRKFPLNEYRTGTNNRKLPVSESN